MRSCLYRGELLHARGTPVAHRFTYPLYMLSLDLDELPLLTRTLRLFGHERARPLSLRDADYTQARGWGLKRSVCDFAGLSATARITLLTHARVFGYAFNPVSFFFCDDDAAGRRVVVAEVANTFGKRHRYLLDDSCRLPAPRGDSYGSDKLLHVSPFMDMDSSYRWHFRAHGEALDIAMDVYRAGELPFFTARLTGERRPLTDSQLARALVRYPLMTVQVVGLIHLEAAKLWIKRAPFFSEPPYDPETARRRHDRPQDIVAPAHRTVARAADG